MKRMQNVTTERLRAIEGRKDVSKDKIRKKRLITGVLVATLIILPHLPLSIPTQKTERFADYHVFNMTETLTSHLDPIINHRNQGI